MKTPPIKPLGLVANQWGFLRHPDRYIETSKITERLAQETTRRQFVTARDILVRLNGSHGNDACRGLLLADDVGLGKTKVAALVAWVVARAGEKRRVRILAPNDVMSRRWEEELLSHVEPLQECAPSLGAAKKWVKSQKGNLLPGHIQVVKHSFALERALACDLLIVDEAHRAKGEKSQFCEALKKNKKLAARVLILTATPFSIRLEDLSRMLSLVGGEAAHGAVEKFSRKLRDFYTGDTARSPEEVAKGIVAGANSAVEALGQFLIRHSIDDLVSEGKSFGSHKEWPILVPSAKSEELELILRMDRVLSLLNSKERAGRKANDPRFHVGWRHLDLARDGLEKETVHLPQPVGAVVQKQLAEIERLRSKVGTHSKIVAVAEAVRAQVDEGEKVIVFCHHHATAQELTVHLNSVLPDMAPPAMPGAATMRAAWHEVLQEVAEPREKIARNNFIEWLCADQVRAQIWSWLEAAPRTNPNLATRLKKTRARHRLGPETIAEAANHLFTSLLASKSSSEVLKRAGDLPEGKPGFLGRTSLPGANGMRVLGVCEPGNGPGEEKLFLHNAQPDTVISIFNSPFGPDVLVVTDKLSEGVDLHRYCRHLVHYELDPSPIRTVQRNGRLRRVNSWSAATGQPIRCAYPAFPGTRDHQLVQIMKKRIDSFSLLLGGVQGFDVDTVQDMDEKWRHEVLALAKAELRKIGGQLKAREY